MAKNDFDLKNLPIEAQDTSISASDFKLVDNTERVHEQKFQTKPTTFFKDSLKRFRKNKSSVVAAGILGTLLLLSVVVPIVDTNPTDEVHPQYVYLEPKLFEAGTGFWDGTKKWEKVAVDINGNENLATDAEKQELWWPSPEDFHKEAVTEKVFSDITYTSDRNKYANGGYVQFGIGEKINSAGSGTNFVEFYSYTLPTLNINDGDIILKTFDVFDIEKLKLVEGNDEAFFPENYSQTKAALYFNYTVQEVVDEETLDVTKSIKLLDYANTFNIGSSIASLSNKDAVNLTQIIKADATVTSENITEFKKCNFAVRIDNDKSGANKCVLIKGIEFETTNTAKETIESANFTDANELMLREYKTGEENIKYWSCNGNKKLHMAKVVYCDFTYDSYEAVFGLTEWGSSKLFQTDIEKYQGMGWCYFDVNVDFDTNGDIVVLGYDYEVIDSRCPVKEITAVYPTNDPNIVMLTGVVQGYQYYFEGSTSMPKFLMGTDKNGVDMFKYVFEGLRTSLLLGICSFAVCFIIGLIWGSISGYFGGTVDLVMERVTDILNGLPWIVVMTLVIKHLGQSFLVFGLSICLTGWIGTAATTRTQFYRFRGREYVLASRSLGASDGRLIAKHILPNAMGTIITSSVLMIPSVIFSEATISYLGLGLQGLSSLGVILSDNQSQLTTHPYLLIFPSVIIALLMISFNLFGNGLRDAVNPSLKGEEQ